MVCDLLLCWIGCLLVDFCGVVGCFFVSLLCLVAVGLCCLVYGLGSVGVLIVLYTASLDGLRL